MRLSGNTVALNMILRQAKSIGFVECWSAHVIHTEPYSPSGRVGLSGPESGNAEGEIGQFPTGKPTRRHNAKLREQFDLKVPAVVTLKNGALDVA